MDNSRTKSLELAHILRQFGEEYQNNHRLCTSQQKAYSAIVNCRTSALGAHRCECDRCGYNRVSYNSCRNRHCPKCQYIKQLIWVDKLKSRLLPTRYFHVVFTVPDFLNRMCYLNQRRCYDMLFKSTAYAIQKTAANPSFLGAQSGCVSVLHTWGQSLSYHPHVHALVPAGGIDADGAQWIYSSREFFVPVKALSKIFRAAFYHLLEKALMNGELIVPNQDDLLYKNTTELKNKIFQKYWHVHIKKTFKGAGQVISYLGRYTHRVAISNSRLIALEDRIVKFRWKDYRDQRWKIMALEASCFIGRFLQHILPCGYYKIRYYGIFSSIHARTTMQQCFALLRSAPEIAQYEGLSTLDVLNLVLGHDLTRCPQCKTGRMLVVSPCSDDGT